MRKLLLYVLGFFCFSAVKGQDNCSSAPLLCNNQSVQGSTIGASAQPGETIPCGDGAVNNSVWFRYTALLNGNVSVVVTAINNNPGLEMQAFSGSCGSLTPLSICTSGSSATGGTMAFNVPVSAGTTYYIMVDGTNGNAEQFNIVASAAPQTITGAPITSFDPTPSYGCAPLNVLLDNTTALQGGSNTTYFWQIDGGAYRPASANDTNITFNFVGIHTVILRSCNTECGCISTSKDITAQDLVSSITATPSNSCLGTPIQFDGTADIQPDPPYTNPGVSAWLWDFGDPASGANNFASGQSVTHAFIGTQTSFQVRLIVYGLCGPDTSYTTVTQVPRPILQATAPVAICAGSNANVSVSAQGSTPPYFYSWSSSGGTITCSTCPSTTITGLIPTGPYTVSVHVTDISGCSTDTSMSLSVNEIPVVTATGADTVCKGAFAPLSAVISAGTFPFNFTWSPSSGLSSSTAQNPTVTVNGPVNYCVIATDAIGCSSTASCVSVSTYPVPTVAPATTSLCASSSNLQNTFTVSGASAGSIINWFPSPDFQLIGNANADSSSITATFPQGVAATYQFTAIVHDAVTGCIDTVNTSFTVSNANLLTVSPSDTICTGSTVTLTANGSTNYSWNASSGLPFSDPTLSSQQVSPATTTTYTVTGTTGSCTATQTVTITVAPTLSVSTSPAQTVCKGTSLTLNASVTGGTAPFSYQWSPVTGLSSSTSQNPTVTVNGPLNYCVTATDAGGCTSTPSCTSISIFAVPTITPATTTLCASGSNLQNTFTVSGASAGSTITWSTSPDFQLIGSASTDSVSVTATFSQGVASTYQFTAIIQDAVTGCIDTVTTGFTVTNNNNLTVTASDTICAGSSITLNANGSATYFWTASNGQVFPNPGQSGQTVSPVSTTTYTVTGTTGACTATRSVTVTVASPPVITVNQTQTVCRGTTLTLIPTVTGGTSPFTYQWNPSSGLNDPSLAYPSLVVNGNANYCVTVSDAAGCTSSAACTSVSVYAPPTISALQSAVCASDTNPQNTFTINGLTPGSSISWSTSPDYALITGATADSGSITVSFPTQIAAGYNFTAIVEDVATGCLDTLQYTFQVTNPNNLTVSPSQSYCKGSTFTLTASGAANYAWSASPPYPFANPTLASQSITLDTNTVFFVTGTTGTCVSSLPISITIYPLPDIAVTPPSPVCGCDTLQLSGSSSTSNCVFSWSSSSGVPVFSPGAASTGALGCPGDIFTLEVTDPSSNCRIDSSVSIAAIPHPAASAAVSPTSICRGLNTVTLDGTGSDNSSGTTYQWTTNTPGVVIADPTSITTTAQVTGNATFTLVVTNSSGCDSTVQISVSSQPAPLISASNPFLCTSDPVLQSTISISGAGTGASYNWFSVSGCNPVSPSGSSFAFDFSGCSPGNYPFSVIVSDPLTGCTDTVSQTISLVSGVVVALITDTTVCEGSSFQISAAGANIYSWSNGQGGSTLNLSGLVAANSPYTYTVTGTVGSCSGTASVNVIVNPVVPVNVINGPTAICGNTSNMTYSTTPPGTGYVWTVSGGTVVSGQGTESITVNWGNAANGSIIVDDTTSGICHGPPQSLSIAISPIPVVPPVVAGLVNVCDSQVVSYNAFGLPGSTFTWTVSGGQAVGSTTDSLLTVQWPDNGSGIITVFETTAAGCTGPTATTNVSINDRPSNPAINGDTIFCQSGSSIYSTPYHPGSLYLWFANGGTITPTGAFTDSTTGNWSSPGTGIISLVETNVYGCSSDTTSLTITIAEQPVVNINTPGSNLCQGSSVSLNATSSNGNLSWITDGTGTFSNTTTASTVYSTGMVDTGIVHLTVIVSNSICPSDSDAVSITISAAPVFTAISSEDSVCSGGAITLTATGNGAYNYFWSPIGLTDSIITLIPNTSITYSVTATNQSGCTSSSTVSVTVQPGGIADAGNNLIACIGDIVQLTGTQQNATGLLWTTNGGGSFSPSATSGSVFYSPGAADTTAGMTYLFLSTTGGCANSTDTLILTYLPSPSVYAGRDTLITGGYTNAGLPLQPDIQQAGGIIWSTTGTGTFVPDATTPFATYVPSEQDFQQDSILITITATGSCFPATDFLVIEFKPFIIPNVFTPYPASPGKNDFFVIKDLPVNSQLKVWDRWGVMVFESTNYQNNWDAANLEADTYYYVLNTGGKGYHGWVQVIRDK